MSWYRVFMMEYLRCGVNVTIEAKGITEEAFERAFRGEAVRRLREVEGIVFEEEMSAEEKIAYLKKKLA